MAKPLRQTLELTIGEETVSLDVTWRIIEVIESVFERHPELPAARAEYICKLLLEDEMRVRRTDIARVIADWVRVSGVDVRMTWSQIREYVVIASVAEMRQYVGAIQGAMFYALKEITADELKQLAEGRDLSQGASDEDDGTVEVETDDDADEKKSA